MEVLHLLGARPEGAVGRLATSRKKKQILKENVMVLLKIHFCSRTAAEFPLESSLARAVCSRAFLVSLSLK